MSRQQTYWVDEDGTIHCKAINASPGPSSIAGLVFSSPAQVSGAGQVQLVLIDTTQGPNLKRFVVRNNGGLLTLESQDDSGVLQSVFFTLNRTTGLITIANALTASGLIIAGAGLQDNNLTAGRVVIVGTAGLVQDNANLLFDTGANLLTVTGGLTVTGVTTFSGLNASISKMLYLNASGVVKVKSLLGSRLAFSIGPVFN